MFCQADVLTLTADDLAPYDAIHASPPCQAFSTISPAGNSHPNLIPATRELLASTGRPYVIENVQGASSHLVAPVMLCGSSFGLEVRRHRLFESNVMLLSPGCQHGKAAPVGVYGNKDSAGTARVRPSGKSRGAKAVSVEHAREVMEMPWATWHGCTQAIPPAYTEFIGRQLLDQITTEQAAA